MTADSRSASPTKRTPLTSLVGMVLAGGRSQRMGTDKALLPHPHGTTFLGHAIGVLTAVCQTVVVAGRARDPAIGDPAIGDNGQLVWLREDPPGQGPLAGLVATMQWAAQRPATEAILAIPVDMPGLQAAHLNALVQTFKRSPGELISASLDGTFAEPLLGIYPLRYSDSLTALAGSGDRSLSRWLQRQSPCLVRLDATSLPNINTPQQLDAWHPQADPPTQPNVAKSTMTPNPANQSSAPCGSPAENSPAENSLSQNSPDAAIARLAARLRTVDTESVPLGESPGRVLRQAIVADRDSPAADVSAMDGYAIRMADLQSSQPLAVRGESRPGHPPPTPDATAAMQVFTGAIVPPGLDAVIRREDTQEQEHSVRLLDAAKTATVGQNIRRQGENSRQGSEVLPEGTLLNTAAIAAAANFGVTDPLVARPVRVTVIVTGDELRSVDEAVEPWQLRDSNGYALAAMFSGQAWIEHVATHSSLDTLDELTTRLQQALAVSDAVVLTGGVSMGDYDHVPAAVTACGGEIIFHRLPLRPGKPILGAATGEGKLILGLPGNPVSAAVCGRRFLMPLLGRLAGRSERACPRVVLADPPPQQLPLWWMRLVRIDDRGQAQLVASRGSGDLVALASSDGFIETPPEAARPQTPAGGPWPFWSWRGA